MQVWLPLDGTLQLENLVSPRLFHLDDLGEDLGDSPVLILVGREGQTLGNLIHILSQFGEVRGLLAPSPRRSVALIKKNPIPEPGLTSSESRFRWIGLIEWCLESTPPNP